jgi:hypothetical protein
MTWMTRAWSIGCVFAVGLVACGGAPVDSPDVKPSVKVQPADLCEEDNGDCGGSSGGGGGGGSGDNFLCCLDQYADCMDACKTTFRGVQLSSCQRGCALLQQDCNANGC